MPKKIDMKNMKWIFLAAVAVAAAAIIGIIVYRNSPAYQARKNLDLGEKYLEELDYEQAIASFKRALEIDPGDEAIIAAVSAHMDEFYQAAREYGSIGEYLAEKEIAALLLTLDSDSYLPYLANGEADFGTGDYAAARSDYEEAKKRGADAEETELRIQLCDAVIRLLELCKTGAWETIADFMNTDQMISAAQTSENPDLFVSEKDGVTVRIEEKDGSLCVICGDGVSDIVEGEATAVISSSSTNAIYEGLWEDGVPNGNGMLTIWNKNESVSEANIYEGVFAAGLSDGVTTFRTLIGGERTAFELDIKNGVVFVYRTDEDGRMILTEDSTDDGCVYTVKYVTGNGDTVPDYSAGVPAFGGSDYKLAVDLLDVIPPEIQCSLKVGYWYVGKLSVGKGITAIDNIDGDITDRIVSESTKSANSYGFLSEGDYKLKVVYSVVDSSGNKAQLTVFYEADSGCGDDYEFVIRAIR